MLPTSILSSLSDMLAAHTGLHFPVERWGDLERGITAVAADFGVPNAESCANRLLSTRITQREIEILAGRLTVGESYFFREKKSFDVLELHILSALLRAREDEGERRLRIWSAGCCTGEEPYSIAMLLDRMIPKTDAWNTTILATDINPAFLRKAAEGKYGQWSFRSTPGWIRDRYFQSQRGSRFKLDERIRKRVAFAYLNLADNTYPSLTNNTNAMDVIFCRNVLMYFSAERAKTVIDNLYRALVDGGWLLVSPAETSSTLFSRFTRVDFDGAILYRKDAVATLPSVANQVPALAGNARQEPWQYARDNIPAENTLAEAVSPDAIQAGSPSTDVSNDNTPIPGERKQADREARDCANQGRLDEAVEWSRKAIAADKLNPAHHYLLSVIRQEQGLVDDAAQSLARALYLDPDFVLAHYAFGNLRQSQGLHREAQRHFNNTLAVLRTHSADDILPESDGLSAGRLMEIIESTCASMPPFAINQ